MPSNRKSAEARDEAPNDAPPEITIHTAADEPADVAGQFGGTGEEHEPQLADYIGSRSPNDLPLPEAEAAG